MNLLVVITGPTASGKTGLAATLAHRFNSVVLSADSRQFFREMKTGTARPDDNELLDVPHYFLGSHSLQEEMNPGIFEKEALALLDDLFTQVNPVFMCGGSGLYINAVCNGLDDLPEADATIREELEQTLLKQGIEPLLNELHTLDPEYFTVVDKKNPHRIIRALEVCRLSGKPYSALRKNDPVKRNFRTLKFALDMPREELYQRINQRVDLMMENGLLQEAESLLGYRHLNALQTVGYKELFDYFDGKMNLDRAVEEIKKNTRRYAKRQLTWLRRDPEIIWVNPDNYEPISLKIKEILNDQII